MVGTSYAFVGLSLRSQFVTLNGLCTKSLVSLCSLCVLMFRWLFFSRNFLTTEGLCPKSGYPCSSLCNLCVLCASVVNYSLEKTTTETQRTQRLHREEVRSGLLIFSSGFAAGCEAGLSPAVRCAKRTRAVPLVWALTQWCGVLSRELAAHYITICGTSEKPVSRWWVVRLIGLKTIKT